jgi:hypothetical protein
METWPGDEGLGWDGEEARRVFRVLEIPWEGATSHELFAKVMGWLEAEEGGEGRRGSLVRRPEARMGEAAGATLEAEGSQLAHR